MAIAQYKLSSNESIIMKNEQVYRGNTNGELILTDLKLVHIATKGAFKKTYITQEYPVNQIKVFNGKAQVLMGKGGNIEVYFINGQETFRFWNDDTLFSDKKAEKEALNWVNAINQLINGENIGSSQSTKTAVVGAEMIAETLGGTVNAFKDALGFKSKTLPTGSIEKTAKKCCSCGAPVSGNKSQVVRCSYCDTAQNL